VPRAVYLSSLPKRSGSVQPVAGKIDILKRTMDKSVPPPSDDEIASEVRAYVVYVSRCVSDVMKLLCLNPCRRHMQLSAILREMGSLQHHADYVDSVVRNFCDGNGAKGLRGFGTWHVEQVTELMLQYLLLGFELELYAPWEVDSIYWYADYVIASMLQNHKNRALLLARQREVLRNKTKQRSKSERKKRKDKPRTRKPLSSGEESIRQCAMEFERLRLNALRGMCRGLFHYFAALRSCGWLPRKDAQSFDDPKTRFTRRFELFESVQQPMLLGYESFVKACDLSIVERKDGVDNAEILLASACQWFESSKSCCLSLMKFHDFPISQADVKLEMSGLMKSAVANILSATNTKRLVKEDRLRREKGDAVVVERQATLTYPHHRSFCVIAVPSS